jgi:ABC-type glycerol-3-phosphate transport system substrate-binding protein
MNRGGTYKRLALSVLLVTLVAASALTTLSQAGSSAKVTITVNGLPPKTDPTNRTTFLADVQKFQRLHPTIHVVPREGFMDPQTFQARLAGRQLENVFYVYFTDPANLIARRQAADITQYVKGNATVRQIKPTIMRIFKDTRGHIFGLPKANYTLGLLYNRKLFQQAGLNPNKPPTNWAQVRTYAKKIAALGNGTVGYGDYSKSNTGGWHFTAELYSLGGSIAVKRNGTWRAAFNNTLGKQVLRQLQTMRWTDKSMGDRQLLEWADLLQMMAAGKLGMYVATSDNIPIIVNQFKGNLDDYGLGAMPNGKGALAGGDGYMFNRRNTPAQNLAGIQWLLFKFVNPNRIASDNRIAQAAGSPVGLPEPNLWVGPALKKWASATERYSNVPSQHYAPFLKGVAKIPLRVEPPAAQQIYAVLDTAMAAVLTDSNANIDQLLASAERQVNSILTSVE